MPEAHPGLGGTRLVFGGNVFGWTIGRNQSFAMLDAFYELGGRMVDSADGYSAWVPGNIGGESEALIGEWMESRGVRRDMRIATKTGMGGAPGGLAPDKVAAALEASLERLRTDYVDLYYAHRDDTDTPLDEMIDAYDTALTSGKARELGASNYPTARLREVFATAERLGSGTFTVLQPKYNLAWRQEYEGELQALCVERGIAVLPYYGLASGFLTGKFRSEADWAGSSRAFALKEFADNGGWQALAALDAVAKECAAAPAQVALAWLNAQSGVFAPIASATNAAQLRELMAATALELTAAQLARLSASVS